VSAHDADLAHLADGGVLAYPTETVWGLAADSRNAAAVARLIAFKGDRGDAPISVLVSGRDELAALGARPGPAASRLLEAFWPGPLTMVLPTDGGFAPGIARADGAVGFRCSPHPVAANLAHGARAAGIGPLTATSCNRSGEPPARTRAQAAAVCGDGEGCDAPRLTAALVPDASGEPPSSVVDASGTTPKLLREGALSAARLAEVASPGAFL
jgi:L-threonylcarbamoyladenylate synthase